MRFSSADFNHRYVCKLANTLDIEFVSDYESIDNSERTFILWNPFGYLSYPQKKYIDKYQYYQKLKEEGKPVYIVERGALPDSIFIDKHGFLCDSTSYDKKYWDKDLTKEQLELVKEYISNFVNDTSTLEPQKSNRLSKEEFFNNLEIDLSKYKKVIFVPLQLYNDTVIILWSDWIKSLRNFQLLIAELAKENPDILFLVKNHPSENNYKNKMDEITDNIKIIDKFHYKDAIAYSDSVLTINSGIGLQAMMWEKPVIIVGKAFYQFDEINLKVYNKQEITNYLRNPHIPYIDMDSVYKFIYYLKYVFYTTCIMKKINDNASEPIEIDKITYQDLNGERINIEKEIEVDYQRIIITQLLELFPHLVLIKDTCLECIQSCELINNKSNLYIGLDLHQDIKNILKENNYNHISNGLYQKNGINIYFEKPPQNTKVMTLWNNSVNVPMPVVTYLQRLYGEKWKDKNIIKKNNRKTKLNIIYTFNNYGWVFEFEANYYKKFSNHNIIPIHQKDLPNYLHKDIDLIVVPSAWHWDRDLQFNNSIILKEFKKDGTKFICQINSELEEKFHVKNADYIMPSSQRIYDLLIKRYKNMFWFPHFVDTNTFNLDYKWNDFTIGFAGNFKNRFKRPHIIERLQEDFNIKLKCDYHGFLHKDRDHKEMLNFYNDIDIYISPSISEGTPMTMMEAMSCKKFVLMTDTGISRYFLDNFNIISNTTDEEIYRNFKTKLNQLKLYKKEQLRLIGDKYRARAIQLDWKNNVQYLDEFYTKIYHGELSEAKIISKNLINGIRK